MDKKLSLKIILLISIAGTLFSGYLTYVELVKKSCLFGGCSYVLGAPSCTYGFVMYLLVFVVSLLGLREKKQQ